MEGQSSMFNDCAKKLKTISKIMFWIGTVCAVIWGISVFDDWGMRWLLSIIIILFVPLALYLNTLLLHTIADIAENTSYSNRMNERIE